MRLLLEALGIIQPDRRRNEPVALPAWTRWGLPLGIVTVAVLGATLAMLTGRLLWALVR